MSTEQEEPETEETQEESSTSGMVFDLTTESLGDIG